MITWTGRRPSALLCLGLACLAAAGIAARGAEEQAAPKAPAPLKIAVVDMTKVLRASKEWQDSSEERSRLVDNARRTLAKLTQQVQVLRNEYDNLPPGTEQRQSKETDLKNALVQLQQNKDELASQIAEHQYAAARTLFPKIGAAVRECATARKINLVLKKQDFQFTGQQSAEQSLLMATTEVLFADDTLEDISAAVVERLNADYSIPVEVK